MKCLVFLIFFQSVFATSCVSDAQCRSNSNCNSYCNNQVCESNSTFLLVCSSDQVCYENVGSCYPKCTKTDDCLSFPFLLHDPYKGVCNLVDGKCSDCLTNSDCLPWSPSTCGAVCKNNILTRENLCYDAVKCNNFQTCNLTSNNNFGCFANSNAIAKEPTFWLYVGFLIFIVYLIFFL